MATNPQLYFNALFSQVLASDALTTRLGSEVASEHCVMRRFRRGAEVAGHTTLIQNAPMVYVWPGHSAWAPMTAQNGRCEATANVIICENYANAGTSFCSGLSFASDLATELLKEADGTGGSSSWLSPCGLNLRARIETPVQDGNGSNSEYRTTVVFTATLHPEA